jgi:phthiocerol/phenolphthiocerol synthesis type-I polyketide synthase E
MAPHAIPSAELNQTPEQVAIIGMAGRFPGARTVDEFWRNLRDGIESIRPFTTEELEASGFDEKTRGDPCFVNAGAIVADADSFDASFFGISVREAEIMDPQHRMFLETAWQALEDAGYDPENFRGLIGIFGGVAPNTYFQNNLVTRADLLHTLGRYSVMLGSERDYAVTRVSFKLNLTGPSLSVNTACSTSGVVIHLACQSLLSGECDMALAGGARIAVPLTAGYLYEEGGIQSPDGHCRAFDADAHGTVVGNGVGMVVLKRLTDAIHAGDCIHAVIRGTAINNDGSQKIGFTAPSIQGQASVIEDALGIAEVSPESINYVEAHGTGTSLGDPIEIAALTRAYRHWTNRKGYCAVGSAKTNIGHLDAGAGVAGVIKTVLALENRLIPPSLNFQRPNPQIDFENSPFYVSTKLSAWPANVTPRRAGVSSFGLGGTNAHIILEEAPETESSGPSRPHQLLLLSAKSDAALKCATQRLVEHLKQHASINLADVAYTLQIGRRAFNHRRMVVCQDSKDALAALAPPDPKRVVTSLQDPVDRDIVFMFSGQGSQYVNMGRDLYETESTFRQQVDRCSEILKPHLSRDLRQILYPPEETAAEAARMLEQTAFTQPALFTIEYALAMLWIDWGLRPRAMVGHSIGEYVAACLAGVFSLEEALSVVSARGRLMQELPGGSMLAVPLAETLIQPYLNDRIDVAVVNSPSLCVVSGQHEAVRDLEQQLSRQGIESHYLHTSHAFHSKMMEPVLESFAEEVGKVRLHVPQIPFVSNVTGTWITSDEAVDPSYWARHLRQTVRLSDCLQELFKESHIALLEVGPGRTLSSVVGLHPGKTPELVVLSSTRHPKETASDLAFILNTLGRFWLAGVRVDWSRFYADEKRQRVRLPTYPFERKRYWISPGKPLHVTASVEADSTAKLETDLLGAGHRPLESNRLPEGAPRNDVEQSLAGIWQGLLGVSALTIHDNFFDLGGSSLLATRLCTQIAKAFGKRLPIAAIFEAPTIEQLARLLDQEGCQVTRSSLVRVQSGQARPPFYCLPGNLGNVFTDLGQLSQHLGLDQPVYGLQDGLGHPARVEALAAHYIEDIHAVQPEGPYSLGGICSGGVIAFEMAQQLTRQGQLVAFLALVEPAALPLPDARTYVNLGIEIWERFSQHLGHHSHNVSALGLREKIMYLRLRTKLIANLYALKRYAPKSYPGRFHLFLTRESLIQSPRIGWRDFAAGGVDVHEIPGTHRSITGDYARIEESHMQTLGHMLRMCMDDASSKLI